MIIKLNKPFATTANVIRDTRSESIDSVGSTIAVDVPLKDRVSAIGEDKAATVSSYLDIQVPENRELIHQALASIIVLDSPSNPKVRSLLNNYNGHLLDMGTQLLQSLRDAAPEQLAARVGDFNENLFYEMQGHKKDVEAIISDNQLVDPSSELHKNIQNFETSIRQSLQHENLTYRGSFMRTEQTIYQPAHVDYDYPVLQQHGDNLFIAFFPLTREGTFLQLWDRSEAVSNTGIVRGTVVLIPYGKMLIVPAHTIHGGGFKRGESGNLRFHLYIELQDKLTDDATDDEHDDMLLHPMNKYVEEHDCRRELCERFVDADGLDQLLGVFFDE